MNSSKTKCHTFVSFCHKNAIGTSLAFPMSEDGNQNGGCHKKQNV